MFKFRIRDLLWLTLVLSVTLGWWIHQSRLSTRAMEAEMRAQHLEGVMEAYGFVFPDDDDVFLISFPKSGP